MYLSGFQTYRVIVQKTVKKKRLIHTMNNANHWQSGLISTNTLPKWHSNVHFKVMNHSIIQSINQSQQQLRWHHKSYTGPYGTSIWRPHMRCGTKAATVDYTQLSANIYSTRTRMASCVHAVHPATVTAELRGLQEQHELWELQELQDL